MRIVKNIEEPTAEFGDLIIGDVFLDGDEDVCMKIPKVHNEFSDEEIENLLEGCMNADDFYDHEANAYCLENNEFFWLDEDEEVRPLKAYLEVK